MPNFKQDTPNEEDVETMENSSSQNQPTALINYLFFSGAAIGFGGILLSGGNLNEADPPVFEQICMAIGCLLMGTSGVIAIVRKEAPRPGLPSIKGIGAIISGWLAAVVFGGLGIAEAIDLLKRWFEK